MIRPTEEDINRVLSRKANPELAKKVASWFATDEGSLYLESLIDNDINELSYDTEVKYSEIDRLPTMNLQSDTRKKSLITYSAKIAAILIPLILIISSITVINSRILLWGELTYNEIYAPKGEDMQIILQDGSKVFLDSDSKIKIPTKFSFRNREVFLEGQAYFEVKSNKSWPFIVNMNGTSVEVLGTSFNLCAFRSDNSITLKLDEGKVRIYDDKNTIDVIPGEIATYDKSNGLFSISKLNEITEAYDWRDNTLFFEDASLEEVIRHLNRKFNINFKIANPKALETYYTIVLQSSSLSEILSELEEISPLEYIYDRNLNIITVNTKKN